MKKQFKIKEVKAREILDCRGYPTIEVEVVTEEDIIGRASVPSGTSRGRYEAFEIRDGGRRYHGKGVLNAVKNINMVVAPILKGRDVTMQRTIDELLIELDGTKNRSKIGGNAITGVSLAVAKTAANALEIPLYKYIGGLNVYMLPVPILDVIEGGKLAASDLDFQEHQIIPIGAESFSEAIRIGLEVYHELGKILTKKWGRQSLNVGLEGGYTPPGLKDPRVAFDIELKAMEELGYEDKFILGLDCAASHIYDRRSGRYLFMGRRISREELMDFYEDLTSSYPLRSVEDPLDEEDFDGFAELTRELNIQIIGDDLFVTSKERLEKGIEIGAANALLLKVNQVGTLTEALDVAELSLRNSYNIVVSERSAQTEDTWLADLAVGLNAGQIKTGVTRGERTAQYNQLIRTEETLGKQARYPGRSLNYLSR